MRAGLITLALVPLVAAPATAQEGTLDLEALRNTVSVSSPRISPDGGSVVLVVSRPDYEENRHESELVLVDVASGERRSLTRRRPAVARPAWSPDGSRLAFLAGDEDDTPQLWVMPMAGGDPVKLTSAEQGVQQFAWRPDGSQIAFATMDPKPEEEGEAKHLDAFEAGDQDLYLEAPIQPSHLWLVSAEGGDARRLTSGEWSVDFVLPPGPPPSPVSWSPDGSSLAYVQRPDTETGHGDSSTVRLLEVESGESRPLTGAKRFETAPRYSPDGGTVAYTNMVSRPGQPAGFWSGNEIWLAPAGGGPGRSLTRELDRNLFSSRWMPDGQGVLVAGNHQTTVGLWEHPLDGDPRRVDLGDLVISGSFGYDYTVGPDGGIAFTASTAHRPGELYHMASLDAEPRRLTDYNAWIEEYRLGSTERLTWESDGYAPDGVVIHPPDFDPDGSYPLVLYIHGGPMAASKQSFDALGQVMAARGWVVFRPNYRGSDNLGKAFQRAIVGDAGAGPGRDVMAGVAELVERPYVDGSRMAVTGWSYGGFMTTWLAGNYPDRWRAAVAGAAVTDLADQYNLADFNQNQRYGMGGASPWSESGREMYREQSPITHAARIRAPTLIMSATRDFRVPVTQSFKLFHALEDSPVETRFRLYPGRTHFPGDPVRSEDVYRNWIRWVEDHLGTPPDADGEES